MTEPPNLQPRQPIAGDASSEATQAQTSSQAGTGAKKSSPEVKPLDGKTTIDDKLSIECEMLCYSAMSRIAEQIASEFHAYYRKLSWHDRRLLELSEQDGKKLLEQDKKLSVQDRMLLELSEHNMNLLELSEQDGNKLLERDKMLSVLDRMLLELSEKDRKKLLEQDKNLSVHDRQLLELSEQDRKKLLERKNVCIIFLDDIFRTALQLHQAAVYQIDLLKDGFKGIVDDASKKEERPEEVITHGFMPDLGAAATAASAGITMAAGLGRSAIDLLSLFRTDVSYTGRPVTIKEAPLVLEIAKHLHKFDWVFLYPRLLLYKPSLRKQPSTTILEKLLADLYKGRQTTGETVRKLAAAVAKAESDLVDKLAEAKKLSHTESLHGEIKNQKKELIPERLKLEAARSQMEALDARLKSLEAGLLAPDAKSGIVPLHLVLQAAELLERFQDKWTNTYFLWAEVSATNGSYQIRRNILGNLIGLSDGLHYSGGVIVTYAFIDGNANLVVSGTHRYREPFTQFPKHDGSITEGNSF